MSTVLPDCTQSVASKSGVPGREDDLVFIKRLSALCFRSELCANEKRPASRMSFSCSCTYECYDCTVSGVDSGNNYYELLPHVGSNSYYFKILRAVKSKLVSSFCCMCFLFPR